MCNYSSSWDGKSYIAAEVYLLQQDMRVPSQAHVEVLLFLKTSIETLDTSKEERDSTVVTLLL